jgi:hypothetical protein
LGLSTGAWGGGFWGRASHGFLNDHRGGNGFRIRIGIGIGIGGRFSDRNGLGITGYFVVVVSGGRKASRDPRTRDGIRLVGDLSWLEVWTPRHRDEHLDFHVGI